MVTYKACASVITDHHSREQSGRLRARHRVSHWQDPVWLPTREPISIAHSIGIRTAPISLDWISIRYETRVW